MVLRPGDAPAVGGPPSSSATTRPREPSDGLIRASRGRVLDQGLGKVVVSGVWLGVMGAWSLWILG